MIKVFCTTFCLLITSALYANSFSHAELELLKAIQGDYSNKGSDLLSLEIKMNSNEQLELFEDNSPFLDSLEMEFELSDSVYGSFYTTDGDRNVSEISFNKDNISFLVAEDDCDNPGCTNFEVEVTFIKNENNSYDVLAEGLASTHHEEASLPALDGADDYEEKYYEIYSGYRYGSKAEEKYFEDQLEQSCIRQFGKTARVGYFNADGSDLYDLYLICDYDINSYLTKK